MCKNKIMAVQQSIPVFQSADFAPSQNDDLWDFSYLRFKENKIHHSWWRHECGPNQTLGDLWLKTWGWRDFFSFLGSFLFHVIWFKILVLKFVQSLSSLGQVIPRLQHMLQTFIAGTVKPEQIDRYTHLCIHIAFLVVEKGVP